ncbi:MAG: HEAT repeat domain-containing protein [Saprospiraceae bacterium]|nr:HEAT repeat domain-containing protein [Saprospiraceae bacterium]
MDREDHILDYLNGQLSETEKIAFERELKDSPNLQQELAGWQYFLQQLDYAPSEVPQIQPDFAAWMEKYPRPGMVRLRLHKYWLIAAAMAGMILITGTALLWQQNAFYRQRIAALDTAAQETRGLLAAAILRQASASDKIQVLNTLHENTMDPALLQALFYALDYDNNVNVRLKAATALGTAMNDPEVRRKLIVSLSIQQHPEVQILLIDLLAAYQEKTAIPALEILLQQESVMQLVKDKAAATLATLL